MHVLYLLFYYKVDIIITCIEMYIFVVIEQNDFCSFIACNFHLLGGTSWSDVPLFDDAVINGYGGANWMLVSFAIYSLFGGSSWFDGPLFDDAAGPM